MSATTITRLLAITAVTLAGLADTSNADAGQEPIWAKVRLTSTASLSPEADRILLEFLDAIGARSVVVRAESMTAAMHLVIERSDAPIQHLLASEAGNQPTARNTTWTWSRDYIVLSLTREQARWVNELLFELATRDDAATADGEWKYVNVRRTL